MFGSGHHMIEIRLQSLTESGDLSQRLRVIDSLVWAPIVSLSATRRPGARRKGAIGLAHAASLSCGATWAFVVCVAVWLMFDVIGIAIAHDVGLNAPKFRLLTATPILTDA